ncbi:MAG: PLP-dependent aminotransferase family protein [Clostridia bacterium]|nr:PLP-dependent aminotransferase family protein [Clostridia bacterium]
MFTVEFKNSDQQPLYIQLYSAVKELILKGALKEGEKLPSKRSLSAHLKISVITVENAYGQLLDEGYIRSKAGSGYYVEKLPRASRALPAHASPKEELQASAPQKTPNYPYNFSTKGTDTRSFPFSVWRKLSRQVLSLPPEELLAPCPSGGVMALRCAIAEYLEDFRALKVDPRQIIVGAGSEYLLGLIIQLLGRSRTYGIEDPGYHKVSAIFKEHGAPCVAIPLDRQGACPDSKNLPDVLHITPAHHFPTGICMPAGRRREVLALMEESGGYIIEDDYDSEFRYKGQIIPTLAAGDRRGRVIYLSTFTKLLAPSMRISYMILPPALLEEYNKRLSFYACTVPVFEQLTLAAFIKEGYFERHINRMKKLYKKRRDALISSIERSPLSSFCKIEGAEAGLHLLLRVSNGMEEQELVTRAKAQGVFLSALGDYRLHGTAPEKTHRPAVILGYTSIDEECIAQSIKKLEKAWIV